MNEHKISTVKIMKNILSIALLSLTVLASTQDAAHSSPKADGYYRCTVSDPTGTPLNVRSTPGGEIIGSVQNGTRVGIMTYAPDSGQWRQIILQDDGAAYVVGWVFKNYLTDCPYKLKAQ